MKITHCKLKKSIQKKLLEFFVLEVTARSAADLLGIQPNSAILFYRKIREVISYHLALEVDEVFDGQIELDESYFGGHRKGKRGRGAAGKVAVFGILKRQGKVFTVVVNDTKITTLMPVMSRKIKPDSWVYTDTYHSYDALDVSEFHHERINHSELFTVKQNHINGIENFWSQAKRILRKYNGIDRKSFPLFLKECEFRFHFGTPKEQLKTLRKWCEI
ncbi:IS1595 family transposase [Glaesserella parasuis]|uniref:IS1595 family transposase n=1 Tax=Glaesserella parasuis TaxID=738 RepID=UPI0004ED979F|nr:IS1595 family transposase [Glaesserella parasuis]AIK89929.1 transposase [Glaesserella parasuis]MCT8764099.1 IS1595 family transposase [Glaesserella parasuis]MDO9732750.1 IS1595 family transposase [Glaesserella parasuis]MDO9953420.1 IS1595 family transposase [Glaesserella parasuis]MDP0042520.1 IS1595 family transposase [Glaesserella parasuis]